MHLPKLTRRRLMAASAPAALAGTTFADRSAALAPDATPPADGAPTDSATPASVEQHVSDLSNAQDATWPASVATSFFVRDDVGRVTQFDETAEKSCIDSALVVVSGTRATGGDGTVTFSVMDYACLDFTWVLASPPLVQVTPQATGPALITATAEIDAAGRDVVITAYSWDVNGQPLANTWFYWTCIVPGDVPVS